MFSAARFNGTMKPRTDRRWQNAKKGTALIMLCFFCVAVFAQPKIAKEDFQQLILQEKKLAATAAKFTEDTLLGNFSADTALMRKQPLVYDSLACAARLAACHQFIPQLVSSLKAHNSFYFPFPFVEEMSVLYAPDSAFRILTWQIRQRYATHRYYGVIQMNTPDLKIFPLTDVSDTLPYQTQKKLMSNTWYGAMYYRMLQHRAGQTDYYTLIGYDGGDLWSNQKIIDVLTFENGQPVFGAPVFFFDDTATGQRTQNRVFVEYKNNASLRMNFDADSQMIIYDHVAPENENEKEAKWSYVPDGTYEGFRWKNKRWEWKEQVYRSVDIGNDNPPVPNPLRDGNNTGYDPDKTEATTTEEPKTETIETIPADDKKNKKPKKVKSLTGFPK